MPHPRTCWHARQVAAHPGLLTAPHRSAPHHMPCHAVLTSCLFLQHSACRWWCTWGPPTRSACSPPCCLSKPSTSAGPGRQAGARHEPHRCRRLQLPRPCPCPCPCRLPLVVPALPRCTAAGAALQSPPVQAQQRLSDFQPSSVCCVCVQGLALRLWFRSSCVVAITFLAILMPWFGTIIGLSGALSEWGGWVGLPAVPPPPAFLPPARLARPR